MVPVCIDFKISWVPNAALRIFMGAIAPMAPTLTHPLSCESFLKKLHNQFHSNKGVERKRGKEKKELLTELSDAGYVESLHELGPNLRSETIAEHDANLVLPFFRYWFTCQEISATFANVLSGL